MSQTEAKAGEAVAINCVARIYHTWTTSLVLGLLARTDAATAEEFVYRLFRRQHLASFLPGLEKLGLTEEPHAVAAAKYHYFSNQLGGVRVEYLEESDRKAWVRYPPPRWIWPAATISAIPSEVNRAMLRGWHAHNGVSLGNPRLGFVCTGTTVDGDPGLEGYYREYDRDLSPAERLVYRPDESCPAIDPSTLPELDAHSWPEDRKARAYRNYAMNYVSNALPVVIDLIGESEAIRIAGLCARHTGLQCYEQTASDMGVTANDATAFANMLATLLTVSGDDISLDGVTLTRHAWRLFPNDRANPTITRIWFSLIEGLLGAHNRFLYLRYSGECPDQQLVIHPGTRPA